MKLTRLFLRKALTCQLGEAAKAYMTEEGYDEVMGARPLRRVVEQQIREQSHRLPLG